MAGTRVALVVLVGLVAAPRVARADDGARAGRPRILDAARIRQLADILRSDPDEKRRKAAVSELADADPRVHPEVMPSLIAALRKDAAGVRAAAAEVIGRFRAVFPLAGDALESAAESDPSPAVREAARQSLWEYHLNGYKSAKGKEMFLAQTAEPPIARPAGARPPITSEPSAAPPVPPAVQVVRVTLEPLPPAVPPPGPRVTPTGAGGPLAVLAGTPLPNPTAEPPIARPKGAPAPVPKITSEPPILQRWPEPFVIGHSPTFTLDLPPIVLPPDGK